MEDIKQDEGYKTRSRTYNKMKNIKQDGEYKQDAGYKQDGGYKTRWMI